VSSIAFFRAIFVFINDIPKRVYKHLYAFLSSLIFADLAYIAQDVTVSICFYFYC